MKEPELIVPQKEIVKPNNMSRRGFLRFLGITPLALAVPSLILPKKKEMIFNNDIIVRPVSIYASGFSFEFLRDPVDYSDYWKKS